MSNLPQFKGRSWLLASAVALLATSVISPAGHVAAANPVASGLTAAYKITFNGFDIGTAKYGADVSASNYKIETDVEVSALLGAFHWHGVTKSSGRLTSSGPKPARYQFNFESSAKSGDVRMGFTDGSVTELTVDPQIAMTDDFVPLKAPHVKSVLDPLTTILAVTRATGKGPCGRKFAVFDGIQRFDLGLVFAYKEPIAGARANGGTDDGIVCRATYAPVGGYRDNGDTQALKENSGIEIAFRTIPGAGLVVPYRVNLPTIAGTVTIEATRIEIRNPAAGQVASVD